MTAPHLIAPVFCFIIALLLAACAAPQPVIIDRGPVLPVQAQRIIDDATATAQVMATSNALATSQRGATQQAADDAYTATANAVNYSQTQSADAHTATAIVIIVESTQAAATRESLALLRADSATQIAVNRQATQIADDSVERDQLNSALGNLIVWGPVGLAAIVLWYVRAYLAAWVNASKPQNAPGAVRVVRVNGGTLILVPTGNGVHRELLPAPSAAVERDFDDEFDTDEEIADDEEEAPMYRGGAYTGTYNREQVGRLTAIDESNRRFILRFLKDALAVSGPDSNRVPDHRTMRYASATWQSATHLIAERITQSKRGRGGGTLLDCTLRELMVQVGERRFIPRVVVEHSPAPVDEPAVA